MGTVHKFKRLFVFSIGFWEAFIKFADAGICLFGSLCPEVKRNCVYLIKQTLNKLCDINSSAAGSLRCDIRVSSCIGSMENSCRSFDVWTGNAYGSTYYYYHLQYGGLTRGVREPIDAFSARCVP